MAAIGVLPALPRAYDGKDNLHGVSSKSHRRGEVWSEVPLG